MEKKLELVFKNAAGSKKVITVADPRDNLTNEEAKVAMQAIVDNNVFESKQGDLVEIVEARMKSSDVEPLE